MTKPTGLLLRIPIIPTANPSILRGQIQISSLHSTQKRSRNPQHRMSTNASPATGSSSEAQPRPKREYLVHLPDHTTPSTLATRLSVRADHLSGIRPALASGRLLFGGATLSAHPDPAEGGAAPPPPPMTGSVMLVTAESEEEVREFVRADVYATTGVWDVQRMTVWPFRTAVRSGVEVGGVVWG